MIAGFGAAFRVITGRPFKLSFPAGLRSPDKIANRRSTPPAARSRAHVTIVQGDGEFGKS
jgi:hypothetical protein